MIGCLYESGTRISELGDLKIKHVKFDQYGATLMVDGKTGMRRVRIIFSSPYLATWLENHLFRDKPEAFVWVGILTIGRNVPLQYGAIRMHLKKIAEKAGIKKRIHPHLFRHSRSTHLANLTEAQMKQYPEVINWAKGWREKDEDYLRQRAQFAPEPTRSIARLILAIADPEAVNPSD